MVSRRGLGWISLFFVLTTAAPGSTEGQLDLASVEERITTALQDTETVNATLQPLVKKVQARLGFLDDLNIELKWFNAGDDEQNPSLGVAYHLGTKIDSWNLGKEECGEVCTRIGADLDFDARGNVAFQQEDNPEDFLDTKLALELFGSHGGPQIQDDTWAATYRKLGEDLANAATQEEVDEVQRKIHQHVRDALDDQFFADLAARVSYEANQDFSAQQLVYGARLGTEIKGWSDLYATSYGDTNWLSRINLPDYPFAALRFLTKTGDCGDDSRCFVPRGVTFPSALASLVLVDPQDDEERKMAGGNLTPFPRFDVELNFKTLAMTLFETDLYFSANFRFYQEIGADDSVQDADLDQFDYFMATLGPSAGPFVRYAHGKLPFDQRTEDVIEVGLKADFGAIKDFLFD